MVRPVGTWNSKAKVKMDRRGANKEQKEGQKVS